MAIKHESNAEFVKRIMTYGCPTGSLVEVFVIEALAGLCAGTLASPEKWDNALISREAWIATAEFVQQELDKKYKPNKEG